MSDGVRWAGTTGRWLASGATAIGRRTTAATAGTTTRGGRGRSSRPTRSGAARPSIASRSIGEDSPARGRLASSCSRRRRQWRSRAARASRPAIASPVRRWRRVTDSRGAARRSRIPARCPARPRRQRRHARFRPRRRAVPARQRWPARGDLSPGHARRSRGSGSSGASAYEQAGVAVPRGLPAERGAVPGPAGSDPRARYGNPATASSPYSGRRRRTRAAGRPSPAIRPRRGRVPPTIPTTPCLGAATVRARRTVTAHPSRTPHRGLRNRRGIRVSDRGRGSQGEAPRATPRSAPSPRAEGPSSRAQGAPAGPRSGSSGGSSSGTAVPRRR